MAPFKSLSRPTGIVHRRVVQSDWLRMRTRKKVIPKVCWTVLQQKATTTKAPPPAQMIITNFVSIMKIYCPFFVARLPPPPKNVSLDDVRINLDNSSTLLSYTPFVWPDAARLYRFYSLLLSASDTRHEHPRHFVTQDKAKKKLAFLIF